MLLNSIITQSIGLFITIYLLIIWSFHRKINSESETIFLGAMIAAIISMLLDIAVQICPDPFYINEINLATVLLRLYLVSIPLCILLITLYVNFAILKSESFRFFRIFIIVFAIVNSVIIFFMPSTSQMVNGLRLPTGTAVFYTYIQSAVIAIIILVELFFARKKLHKATFIANLVWLLLFLSAGFIQYASLITLGIPIVSFVVSLGTIAIYLVLENPGNKYDYWNYRFHYETFVKYISEMIKFQELQSILYINLGTRNNNKLFAVNEVFSEIIMQHKKNMEIKIFKGISNELIITSKELYVLQDVASTIYESISRAEHKNNVEIYASITLIPSISKIKNYRILRDIMDEYKIKSNLVTENIRFFTVKDKMIDRFNNEAVVTSDIDYAIKNKKIDIKFQSIDSLADKNKKIYEIITILRNEENKELYPSEYSRVANKTNKFLQIDECSFEKICSVLDSVLSHNNSLEYILVRISVQALEDDSFLDRIVELLRRHDIPYRYICFEITNADAIVKKDILLKNITYMQRLGIAFAIGGFGSGESNLNYFIDLPMNIVKYDQSILRNAIENKDAALIMKDVTELAHSLGYKVIAVGAKTENEIKFIEECNIEMAIGDQFSNILNENDFIQELSNAGGQL